MMWCWALICHWGTDCFRLDVRLQDAVAGETLASVSEKGNESEIDSLVSKAGAELRAKLGVRRAVQTPNRR